MLLAKNQIDFSKDYEEFIMRLNRPLYLVFYCANDYESGYELKGIYTSLKNAKFGLIMVELETSDAEAFIVKQTDEHFSFGEQCSKVIFKKSVKTEEV